MGRNFTTNVGIPPGDCLSPKHFILYLANAMQDHTPSHLIDRGYSITPETNINQQYADNIGWVSEKPKIYSRSQNTREIKRKKPSNECRQTREIQHKQVRKQPMEEM